MKILTRKEFLALKGPVLYSKWYTANAGPGNEMFIKYDTWENDWVCQPLGGFDMVIPEGSEDIPIDVWMKMENNVPVGDLKVDMECAGRDSLFETEDECKFVVFDADDLKAFLGKITNCFKRALTFAQDYAFKPLAIHGQLMHYHLIEKLSDQDKEEIRNLISSMVSADEEQAKANLHHLEHHTVAFVSTNYSTKAFINTAIVIEKNKLKED